jgi:DNA polymerase-4
VAPNKFLAKLASDENKPDGVTIVEPDKIEAFLHPLPIERMWGVGPVTAKRLQGLGIHFVGDLARRDPDWMKQAFGNEAERFTRLSRGLDNRPVTPDHEAKSIGHEQTFGVDLESADEVRRVLLDQAEAVARRLRRHEVMARTVTVKIRFGDFQTITRSATLTEPTCATEELWQTARQLFDRWAASSFSPVRLIGLHASGLNQGGQMGLFEDDQAKQQRNLDAAADTIVAKFGKSAIRRGGTMPDRKKAPPEEAGPA